MLTLQRASAGSGKTYTLTKKYIRLLISIPIGNDGEGPRRLRSKAELADGVQRILAVTFTNKATNEMKERIISKLNDLAYPPHPQNPLKVDYMKDFIEEFKVTSEDISATCRRALREVLYNYSDFSISTIDAFFQTILRTFAYESDLPDGYQVVIGNEYLGRLAAKGIIDDLAEGRLPEADRKWFQDIIMGGISDGFNHWKIFQRIETSNPKMRDYDAFTSIIKMADELDKEEYKEAREALDNYFVSSGDLRESYNKINREFDGQLLSLFSKVKTAAKKVVSSYDAIAAKAEVMAFYGAETPLHGRDIIFSANTTTANLRYMLAPNADPMQLFKFKAPAEGKSHFKKMGSKSLKGFDADVSTQVAELAEAVEALEAFKATIDFDTWKLVRSGISRIAIMRDMRRRIAEYLNDNDAMQLADTNSILQKIISDDDVPFIYERIGSRINHFLIDEFQDTSRMQWRNFYPLLAESLARGNENLIIGDAKQSIYRFRNAEPKLITDIVPSSFSSSQISLHGYSDEENSNWRSERKIVCFNNFVFHSFARALDEKNERLGLPLFSRLYGNTVQLPRAKGDKGYVEIKYIPAVSSDDSDRAEQSEQGEDGSATLPILKAVENTVISLLRRGYQQRHIAILVNTRVAGEDIIAHLMALNNNLPKGIPLLKFVSEDSLRLCNSEAVNIVIECFRLILGCYESDGPIPAGENAGDNVDNPGNRPVWASEKKTGKIDANSIAHKFGHYLQSNPGGDLHTRFSEFINSNNDNARRISDMMNGMQAVTLPSLTEMLIENFVPLSLRSLEAPFLAALQDNILDYCEVHPSDVGSMLRWWDRTGKNISISSPEGTEAINVMTIHKSKGLEFPVVILPDLDLNFNPRKEWIWIDTPKDFKYAKLLPAKVPVLLTEKMARESVNAEYRDRFCDLTYLHQADQLNKAYVAATRAETELYIFFPDSRKSDSNEDNISSDSKKRAKKGGSKSNPYKFGEMLREILEARIDSYPGREDAAENDGADSAEACYMPDPHDIKEQELAREFTYGEKIEDVPGYIAGKKHSSGSKEVRNISDYYVYSDRDILKYHEEGPTPRLDPADDDREDPRSEGSLLHAVLENTIVEADLPRALEKQRIKGFITRAQIKAYFEMLSKALASVRERGWFAGRYQVFTELPLLTASPVMRRPDRIMFNPETQEAIVVDYKFGASEKLREHLRQVRGYMRMLKDSRKFTDVKGYLWYVRENKIVEV